MLRILLTILLPVVLPLVLYLTYVKYFRPQPSPGAPPEVTAAAARHDRRVVWILMGGGLLLVAGMLSLGFSRGVPPGTKLIAPHMENGKIVPSRRAEPEK